MKRNPFRRGGALLLLLALLLGVLPAAAAAEGGTLYVTGYTVQDSAGRTAARVTKGDTVNIAVTVKDTGDGTGAGDPAALDITKLEDSFTGGSVNVRRVSEDGAPLRYEILLTGVTYKGVGQSLRLQVGTAGQADSYQTMEVTVTEAVVYEAPERVPEIPSTPDAAPVPLVTVSRNELKQPIQAGQEAELTITFRNLSNARLKSPVAVFTPTEGLEILGGSNSFPLDEIAGKKSATVKLRIKAASVIQSPAQSLGVELRFNYHNNISLVQGSITDKISIPALGRESVPQPPVLVTRSPLETPVAPGETREVTISFQNSGATKLVGAVASVTASESLMLLNDTTTFLLGDIAPGKTGSITVRFQAARDMNSANQSLSTELKFGYDNGGMLTQATASDKVGIPAVPRESVAQPLVILTRSAAPKPLAAGESRSVELSFRNAGTTKVVSPMVTVTPSDAILLLNDASSFLLPDLEPGKSASLTLRIQGAAEIGSANQSLSTELKYSYHNGETMAQATASDRINLTAVPTGKGDSPQPNVVIRSFSYGEGSVASGSSFPLSFTFENTGRLGIENLVITVEGGESFAMNGSTNTFYYPALGAGESQTREVPMRAVPTGKSGAQSVSIGFKYEYVDGAKRAQATSDIKVSIPLYQPDRLQINAPTLPETATEGEELELTLAYVNKGKDDIANVEATVVGEGVTTPARTQYLGNLSAGSSGAIGFAVTPEKAGPLSLVLRVTYENADQQLQTREFPVELQVEEFVPSEDPAPGAGEEEGQPFPWPLVLGGSGGGLVLLLALLRWKKGRAKPQTEEGGDWTSWEEESEP